MNKVKMQKVFFKHNWDFEASKNRFSCVFLSATSWQIPKYLPLKNKENGKNEDTVKETTDKTNIDGKFPRLDVQIMVDGKDEKNNELCSHTTGCWNQPKRLVNQQIHSILNGLHSNLSIFAGF